MALKQDINAPQPVGVPGTLAADTSAGTRASAIGGALATLGEGIGTIFANQSKNEADRTLASAIGGISDLEQKREELREQNTNLRASIAALPRDEKGNFSEEAKAKLESMQEEIDFLEQASQTGVLNSKVFSTRMNTIYRDHLSRAENLGIQSNIAQLFAAKRTEAASAPTLNAEQKAITSQLDVIYGPGNWGAVEAGDFVGKQRFAAAVFNKEGATASDVSLAFAYQIEPLIQSSITADDKGGTELITPVEIAKIQDNVQILGQERIKDIRGRITTAKRLGTYTDAMQAQAEGAIKAVNEQMTFYTKTVWEERFPDRTVNGALKQANEMRDQSAQAHVEFNAIVASKMLGGSGAGGGLSGQAAWELAGKKGPIWDMMYQRYGEALGYSSSEEYRLAEFGSISRGLRRELTYQQMADAKLILPALADLVNGKAITKPTRNKPEQTAEVIETVRDGFKVNPDNPGESADSLNMIGKQLQGMSENAKSVGQGDKLGVALKQQLRNRIIAQRDSYARNKIGTIGVDDQGNLLASTPRSFRPNFGPSEVDFGSTRTDGLGKNNKAIDKFAKELIARELMTLDEYKEMFEEPEARAPEAVEEQTSQVIENPLPANERARIEQRLENRLNMTNRSDRAVGEIEFLQSQLDKDDAVREAASQPDAFTGAEQQTVPRSERPIVETPEGADPVVDNIIGAETGGQADPNTARNPNSSATGAGQFIDSTWIETISKARPDLIGGLSRQEVLDLRTDPEISREMVAAYADNNKRILERRGHATTPGNVYLAHFAGPGGANALLSADPSTPVSQVLDASQIEANKSVLEGKTAGEVIKWAKQKMNPSLANIEGRFSSFEDGQYEDSNGRVVEIANGDVVSVDGVFV